VTLLHATQFSVLLDYLDIHTLDQ